MPNAMTYDETAFLDHIATLAANRVLAGEKFTEGLIATVVEDYKRSLDRMRADWVAQNGRHEAMCGRICRRVFDGIQAESAPRS